MKRIIGWMLAIMMLLGLLPAATGEVVTKYDHLTVETGTAFSGNFFSEVLGNNVSDQDVRNLIHGYNLVNWDSATGSYQFNPRLIAAASVTEDGTGYIIALREDLTYNDKTPITAKDYVFSLLLLASPELEEAAGSRADFSRILGGKAYQEGTAFELSGVRLLGDYLFSLSLDPKFLPYFYQLKALDISPMPLSVIAPDCDVRDDGRGAYIDGDFSADLLEDTLMNPLDGYITYPKVTCGPYMLTEYTGRSVVLDINPQYIGDRDGTLPSIPRIIFQQGDPDKAISDVFDGKADLVVRCVREEQISAGLDLARSVDFSMDAYSRPGVSFISFCAEKGATADVSVRQALRMCLDREKLTELYTKAYGITVDGMYGIGQWMYLITNGTLVPEEGEEEEWADLNLDGIRKYEFNPPAAEQLLEENGWEVDRSGLLSKAINGQNVDLSLKLIYPEGNGAGPLLDEVFTPYLQTIGIELTIEAVPMPELLRKYYRQEERDCDMILLGTNFGDLYDPSGEYDEQGTSSLTGITDPELRELAVNMRETEPGNTAEYCRRWLRYQERLAEIAANIPLYSDAYFDFHISALQWYAPERTGSWSKAITGAILSDFVQEEKEEPEEDFELEGEGEGIEDLEGADLE